MSFLQREIDKIHNELITLEEVDETYRLLQAASQALSWAIDPNCYKSPYNTIMDIQGEIKDCLDEPRQTQSLGIYDHCA
jgi:hypothetical protein